LCEKVSIQSFTYWKITENSFPYDQIAKTHHMLVPLRHVIEDELSKDELAEFKTIKAEHVSEYDWIIEATAKNKSIPNHFHLHFIVGR
jgi:diadenosine tetraphosphate (Ap4A) HIT family hydrolase